MPGNQAYVVLAAARLFALLAIAGPLLWLRQPDGIFAMLVVGGLWGYQAVASIRRDLKLILSPAVEGAAIGVICAVGMTGSPNILAAMVVPLLYATLIGSLPSLLRVALIEIASVVLVGVMWSEAISGDLGIAIFTWLMVGIGLSLVTNVAFAQDRAVADALAPYRDAQDLIRQLIDLSGDLSSGLDPGALAGELLATVGDRFPTRSLYLYVPRGDTLTAVANTGDPDSEDAERCKQLALDAYATADVQVADEAFSFNPNRQCVVAGRLTSESPVALSPTLLRQLEVDLMPSAVRLDTALLFAQFRDSATADERQRLAREMHDGVAQDIASLGYIVDALAAKATDEGQAKALVMLRDRVTKVVAEVRQSVMNLRTSIGENESLGAAISGVARHLSEASGIAIQVRLEEQPARLRPEVEAELFRIAQEAINNAVKHSKANSIDVLCRVDPPNARITVTDDGVGLQKGRSDSHGLKIMRERAKLIGAELTVRDNASRGLTVSVTLRSTLSN